MSYWLIGDAPPKDHVESPEACLTPDATGFPNLANGLLGMTGWTIGEFLEVFATRRMVWKKSWPQWVDEGKHRATLIAEEAEESLGLVLVGQMTAVAFGLGGVGVDGLFTWSGRYAVIPHPAPTRLMRYWKIPGMREKARNFFDDIRREAL